MTSKARFCCIDRYVEFELEIEATFLVPSNKFELLYSLSFFPELFCCLKLCWLMSCSTTFFVGSQDDPSLNKDRPSYN